MGREWRKGEGRGGNPGMPKSRVGNRQCRPSKTAPDIDDLCDAAVARPLATMCGSRLSQKKNLAAKELTALQ